MLVDLTTSINNIYVKDKFIKNLNLMSINQLDQLKTLQLQIKDEGFLPLFHGTNMHQFLALYLHKNEKG